jgi:hypothetical protein
MAPGESGSRITSCSKRTLGSFYFSSRKLVNGITAAFAEREADWGVFSLPPQSSPAQFQLWNAVLHIAVLETCS